MTTAVQNSVASTVTDHRDTASKRAAPGKLIAITASGPIYASPATFTMIPLSSAMALYGELAARVLDPKAKVVSSLPARLGGETAYKAWVQQTSTFAASITRLSPAQRVATLQEVLHYVRHRGVDGNETVLAAAINGAWPYLSQETLEWTLHYAKSAIARSTVHRQSSRHSHRPHHADRRGPQTGRAEETRSLGVVGLSQTEDRRVAPVVSPPGS